MALIPFFNTLFNNAQIQQALQHSQDRLLAFFGLFKNRLNPSLIKQSRPNENIPTLIHFESVESIASFWKFGVLRILLKHVGSQYPYSDDRREIIISRWC